MLTASEVGLRCDVASRGVVDLQMLKGLDDISSRNLFQRHSIVEATHISARNPEEIRNSFLCLDEILILLMVNDGAATLSRLRSDI